MRLKLWFVRSLKTQLNGLNRPIDPWVRERKEKRKHLLEQGFEPWQNNNRATPHLQGGEVPVLTHVLHQGP